MVITNSPDISVLRIAVIWDISNMVPVIRLTNLSQGADLGNIEWTFFAKSPSGTWIYEGDTSAPTITGDWDDYTISSAWPRPFNQIEWSGAPYTFWCTVKDSSGNEYTGAVQVCFICRPNGNTKSSKSPYGIGNVEVKVMCQQAGVFFQDVTNVTYKGIAGTQGSSVLRLNYPMDETGTVPDPFEITHFVTATAPISFSSPNYQFIYTSVWQYDFDNDCSVRIKYAQNKAFPVLCNIDLMPLVCEYTKLIQQVESGNCANVQEAQQKLSLINSKMMLVFIGIEQPLTGVDVPVLIEEIKAIGGWDCDCCNAATGIIPTNGSLIDGFNFQVISLCGDISGYVQQVGNNVQFFLADKSYVFSVCPTIPTEAFTVTPSTDGCQKSYCLNIDMTVFANDLLTVIANNADLVNLFNSIVIGGGSGIIVDGGCIWDSSLACDYVFTFENIPASSTYAILTGIKLSQIDVPANFAFNLTNLAALQTYLNGLGLGTFVVTAGSPSGTVVVTSEDNTSGIIDISYSVASVAYTAEQSKICPGYIPITEQEAIQRLVNYICALDDSKVKTSAEYVICYIDPEDGLKKTATIESESSLTLFISTLLARGCDTIDYIKTLTSTSCDGIKSVFSAPVKALDANNRIPLMTDAGCGYTNPLALFYQMLKEGFYNNEVVNAFCDIVNLCRGSVVCNSYTEFSGTLVAYSDTCPAIVRFYIVYSSPENTYYVYIVFANATSTPQEITIEYKLNNTDVWTTMDTSASVSVDGTTIGVYDASPIIGLATGTYDFRIASNCESPSEWVYLYNVYIENIPV